MHMKGEAESAGRVEQVEISLRGDLWKKDSSEGEREGLQDGPETCYDVLFGDSGTETKTESRAEDVQIFIMSEQDGQD